MSFLNAPTFHLLADIDLEEHEICGTKEDSGGNGLGNIGEEVRNVPKILDVKGPNSAKSVSHMKPRRFRMPARYSVIRVCILRISGAWKGSRTKYPNY